MAKRNFKKEYKNFHGKPAQIKRRAQRNAARAKMVKAGKVRKGDKRDVDHKNGRTADNSASNLRAVSRSKNRGYRRTATNKNLGLKR